MVMTERGTEKDREGQTRTEMDRPEQRVPDGHKEGPHDMVMAEGGTDKDKEGQVGS